MRTMPIARPVIAILVLSLVGYCRTLSAQDVIAPQFSLPDLQGNMITSESFRGKLVVIHFATTWCPFCNAEAPHLEALYKEYRQRGVEVLIIDVQEPRELIAERLRDKFNLSFPVLVDLDGAVAARFAPPDVLPDLSRAEVMLASNLILDREGKIRLMSLLDSQNFDAKLVSVKQKLDSLLAAGEKTGNRNIIRMNNLPPNHIQAGKQVPVELAFQIDEGFHIQANKVNDPNLIPAALSFACPDGIAVGEAVFPPYGLFQLEGASEAFWVFDKSLRVAVPVSVAANKPAGTYLLKGKLHYQACDSRRCYFPDEFPFEMALEVN